MPDEPTRHLVDPDAARTDVVATLDDTAARILVLRGRRVLLDVDLARLYGVPPKRLNEQVKRNHDRFPLDFMFQLTDGEVDDLRSQFQAVSQIRPSSSCRWPGHQSRERVT